MFSSKLSFNSQSRDILHVSSATDLRYQPIRNRSSLECRGNGRRIGPRRRILLEVNLAAFRKRSRVFAEGHRVLRHDSRLRLSVEAPIR